MNIQLRRVTSIVIGVVFLSLALLVIRFVPASTREIIPFQPKTNEEQYALLIADLKANLEVTDLSQEDRALLEGKLAGAEISATREALYGNVDPATAWAEKQTSIAQATTSPIPEAQNTPLRLSGIVVDHSNIGFNRIDKFTNYWIPENGEANLLIFAGHERAHPEQGIICIVEGTPGLDPEIRIKVPGDTGNLALIGSEFDWLFISAENGAVFKFSKSTFKLFDAHLNKEIPIELTESKIQSGTAYP